MTNFFVIEPLLEYLAGLSHPPMNGSRRTGPASAEEAFLNGVALPVDGGLPVY
jgi:hypothetical protein